MTINKSNQPSGADGSVKISVVIPVHNEELNIAPLLERLVKTLESLDTSYEIIFVDDGSRDNTTRAIMEARKSNGNILLVKLSRNFGQHAALQAGFDICQGEHVVMIDADMQEAPEDIPKLLDKAREGFDLVYGMKSARLDSPAKKISSSLFVWVFNLISPVKLPERATTMRVMSRRFIDSLGQMEERVRFMAAMSSWLGFSRTGVEVEYSPRAIGDSKYSFYKLLKMTVDGMLSFSTFPLRLVTIFGLTLSLICTGVIIFIVGWWLFSGEVMLAGWPSIIVSIFMLAGIQCVFIGILGEYIGRIYIETKRRPLYVIEDVSGDAGVDESGDNDKPNHA